MFSCAWLGVLHFLWFATTDLRHAHSVNWLTVSESILHSYWLLSPMGAGQKSNMLGSSWSGEASRTTDLCDRWVLPAVSSCLEHAYIVKSSLGVNYDRCNSQLLLYRVLFFPSSSFSIFKSQISFRDRKQRSTLLLATSDQEAVSMSHIWSYEVRYLLTLNNYL